MDWTHDQWTGLLDSRFCLENRRNATSIDRLANTHTARNRVLLRGVWERDYTKLASFTGHTQRNIVSCVWSGDEYLGTPNSFTVQRLTEAYIHLYIMDYSGVKKITFPRFSLVHLCSPLVQSTVAALSGSSLSKS